MSLQFYENILTKHGFTTRTLKAICLHLDYVPFDKKQDKILSSINKDGSVITISLMRSDNIRITFHLDKNGKTTVVSTKPNGEMDLSLSSKNEPTVGVHFILQQMKAFFQNNQDI